jgi:hypothetical protein
MALYFLASDLTPFKPNAARPTRGIRSVNIFVIIFLLLFVGSAKFYGDI